MPIASALISAPLWDYIWSLSVCFLPHCLGLLLHRGLSHGDLWSWRWARGKDSDRGELTSPRQSSSPSVSQAPLFTGAASWECRSLDLSQLTGALGGRADRPMGRGHSHSAGTGWCESHPNCSFVYLLNLQPLTKSFLCASLGLSGNCWGPCF